MKNRLARRVGLLYLAGGAGAPFSLLYLPRLLVVRGDPSNALLVVRRAATLIRLGILADLACALIFLFIALTLQRLFEDIDRRKARLMVIFWIACVPVTFVNVLNRFAALVLASGASFLAPFSPPQLGALTMLALRLYQHGNVVAQIFWGLWLLPFGVLAYRSRFMPRLLGILLVIGGCAYVAASVSIILFGRSIAALVIAQALGEIPAVAWLAIKGADGKTS
ncbi:MAG TPA: DUF4386 domain-containing protein [Thermoanaerobaculia bacterium]